MLLFLFLVNRPDGVKDVNIQFLLALLHRPVMVLVEKVSSYNKEIPWCDQLFYPYGMPY